jgi:hypothetical protein
VPRLKRARPTAAHVERTALGCPSLWIRRQPYCARERLMQWIRLGDDVQISTVNPRPTVRGRLLHFNCRNPTGGYLSSPKFGSAWPSYLRHAAP